MPGTKAAPIFDMADYAGPEYDLLVTDAGRGQALAKKLDSSAGFEKKDRFEGTPRALVLMCGHGTTTISPGVRSTVYHGASLCALSVT